MKGSIKRKEIFGRTPGLQGMHTWDDAFFLAKNDFASGSARSPDTGENHPGPASDVAAQGPAGRRLQLSLAWRRTPGRRACRFRPTSGPAPDSPSFPSSWSCS
ncbi:MAG: hypothetical protein M0C28_07995 [Candidatus Moduliflexus flocculans]|nr:hypothetical protein [Candidatus Moduliflexus flocculans]